MGIIQDTILFSMVFFLRKFIQNGIIPEEEFIMYYTS